MKEGLTRELVAARVAAELKDGMYVNLGVGLPTLVANFLPPDQDIVLHTENGILGFGPAPDEEDFDIDLVNARGRPVTLRPGASFFHQSDSFAMIRGGHLDVAVLGAYQVSERGDLANWRGPDAVFGTVGGAMDLVCGVRRIIIAMEHTTPTGMPKIVRQCSYPLTGPRVVNTIVTNLALIEVTPAGLLLCETAPGWEPEAIQEQTEPKLIISPQIKEMAF